MYLKLKGSVPINYDIRYYLSNLKFKKYNKSTLSFNLH